MKISAKHYAELKAAIAPLAHYIPAHREALKKDPRVKNLEMRLRWDLLHASKFMRSHSYEELGAGVNDTHIDTALRQIMKELTYGNPRGERLTGTKMKGNVDHVAARELFLFIQNDSVLYRQEQAIDKNLRLKLKRGVFDKALAVKLFMYLADAGAIKYVGNYAHEYAEHAKPSVDSIFNRKTRFAVAAMLTKYWIDARRNDGLYINPAIIRAGEGQDEGRCKCGHILAEHRVYKGEYASCSVCNCVSAELARPKKNPSTPTLIQPFFGATNANWNLRKSFSSRTEAVKWANQTLVKNLGIPRNCIVVWDGKGSYKNRAEVYVHKTQWARAVLKNPISKRFAHRAAARVVNYGLDAAHKRGWIKNPLAFHGGKWKPYCNNCGQWQYPTKNGYLDCTHECARRGFETKTTRRELNKRAGH